jgi:hypothetical protein
MSFYGFRGYLGFSEKKASWVIFWRDQRKQWIVWKALLAPLLTYLLTNHYLLGAHIHDNDVEKRMRPRLVSLVISKNMDDEVIDVF